MPLTTGNIKENINETVLRFVRRGAMVLVCHSKNKPMVGGDGFMGFTQM